MIVIIIIIIIVFVINSLIIFFIMTQTELSNLCKDKGTCLLACACLCLPVLACLPACLPTRLSVVGTLLIQTM
jgi:hypothetical protein